MTNNTVVAHVNKDYIKEADDVTRVGTEWTVDSIYNAYPHEEFIINLEGAIKKHFRLLDDDNEVYYGGWLLDDAESLVQQAVLSWGTYDAGCTTIEVRGNDNEWQRVIG